MDAEAYFSWLARHELSITDVKTIEDLQSVLLAQKLTVNQAFQQALLRTAIYENRVFQDLGIKPVFFQAKLYERLGFGVAGRPGFFSWESIKKMFGIRGPKSE